MMSNDNAKSNQNESEKIKLDKSNIYDILKDLGKEYSKLNRHGPNAEVIIVGGASSLLNYDFRDSTIDVDALIFANSAFKEAINKVGDKHNLPNNWFNSDFKKTESYSDKLIEHSKYYKTFYNALSVRTINGEYLVAMKLVSDRPYKHDFSDIVGIIKDEQANGRILTFEDIDKAMVELYGDWDKVNDTAKEFLINVLNSSDLEKLYEKISQGEFDNKEVITNIVDKCEDIVNSINVEDFVNEFCSVLLSESANETDIQNKLDATDTENIIDTENIENENNFIEYDDYYDDIDNGL